MLRPLTLTLCMTLASPAWAQPAPNRAPAQAPSGVTLTIQRESLPNGLRVVLAPDRTVPTVAVAIYYDVGSRVEPEGRTGFAHLFEHLMFEGTEDLPKGEFDRLLALRGADSNATTSEDRTNYFEMLPSSALELGLWLEADRMRALAVTAEAFENQRLTVQEERRQSYENRPYMPSFLRRDELAYQGYFPYSHSTIGDMRDLEMPGLAPAAQLQRVRDFHARFYAPDNAVLAIAGDFEPAQALELVRRHFGGITTRRGAPWSDPGFTPVGRELTEQLTDTHAELPAFHLVWHIPPRRTTDHYPLELLASILGNGESSRLYRTLVKDQELLAEVQVGTEDRRGPDMFALWALCAEGHTPAEGRAAVDQVLARLLREGVTERELQKAKNTFRAAFVFNLQTPLERAEYLGMTELYHGDATLVNSELSRYDAVTLADLARVARQYLVPSNRIALDVLPAPAAPSSAPAAP
ncbi:MAG: insulinase family protein [Deltaproteobacteria bacterium]|nr:insulinase family protein [Deltaproteobacteria bacterium]